MNLWIQRHDFSSDERDRVEIEDARNTFINFDWDSEIAKEEVALAEGRDCCNPGMGLISEGNRILHLVPGSRGLMIHYHFPKRKKFLGFLHFEDQETVSVNEFPNEEMNEALRLHYAGEHELLINFLHAFGTSLN